MRREDQDYMKQALILATRSPDPSTQNGAVIIDDKTGHILGMGHNCFPVGVSCTEERWKRPTKYSFVEHAERNAIFDAFRNSIFNTSNPTECPSLIMYCPWFACSDCARAIIQSGIKEMVGIRSKKVKNGRWDKEISFGERMFAESGVTCRYIDMPEVGIKIRQNGQEVNY